jgi:hypothetical protein
MNIEQTVLENLRLLPTDKQQDVLVFIHSLLPSEQTSLNSSQKYILSNLCTTLQQIQNFHDGLPSAAYVNRLLQSTQALIASLPHSPISPSMTLPKHFTNSFIRMEMYRSYLRNVIKFYETLNLPTIRFRAIAEALQTILEQGATACACRCCERIGDVVIALDAPRHLQLEHTAQAFDSLCPPIFPASP